MAPVPFVIDTLGLRVDYSRSQFFSEPWRIVSGHLVHASWPHLLMNLANIVLLRLVFPQWLPATLWLSFIIFSAVFISLGLWVMSSLSSYVGFSGIFHGFLLYLLLYYQDRIDHKATRLLLFGVVVLLIVKIANEQIFGASEQLADLVGIAIAIDAHLLGAISGLLFWLLGKAFW
ncbi:MAG: rhombosortase, partial [Pseudomonadota bacterium]